MEPGPIERKVTITSILLYYLPAIGVVALRLFMSHSQESNLEPYIAIDIDELPAKIVKLLL